MNIAVWLGHFFLISGGLYAWSRAQSVNQRIGYWLLGLIMKLAAGIALGLIYTHYYAEGDTFLYFQDGARLATWASDNFASYFRFLLWDYPDRPPLAYSDMRALFFTKITSLFCLFTFNNYWLTAIYFSLIGFVGAWQMFAAASKFYPERELAAGIAYLFFPSVVFWTSGLIKETIACSSLFYLSALFLRVWFGEKPSWQNWLAGFVALWLLWTLKYYYAAIFVSVAVTTILHQYLISHFLRAPNIVVRATIWVSIFLLPLFLVTFLHPNFNLDRILTVIVSNNQLYAAISAPEDLIHYRSLDDTAASILSNSPWAVVSAIYRPVIWEAGTFFQFVIAIENFFLVLLTLAILFYWQRIRFESSLVIPILVYVIGLAAFLALSTPNFGTLSRYRVAFLPYLLLLLLWYNPWVAKLQTRLAAGRNVAR